MCSLPMCICTHIFSFLAFTIYSRHLGLEEIFESLVHLIVGVAAPYTFVPGVDPLGLLCGHVRDRDCDVLPTRAFLRLLPGGVRL